MLRASAYLIALVLAACASAQPPNCTPRAVPSQTAVVREDTEERWPVRYYLDASKSMSGFVDSGGAATIFTEVVGSVPLIASNMRAAQTNYFLFGDDISKSDESEFVAAGRRRGLLNRLNGDIAGVITRIDQGLESDVNAVSIVMTDLFLSGKDIPRGSNTPLTHALIRLIKKGQSIAIIGFRSRFSGTIYDLTTVKRGINHSGLHPFYAIISGPHNGVMSAISTIQRLILTRLDEDEFRVIHFSKDVGISPVTNSELEDGQVRLGNGIRRERTVLRGLPTVPQFSLSELGADPIRVTIPRDSIDPFASMVPKITGAQDKREMLYAYLGKSSNCADNWIPWDHRRELAAISVNLSPGNSTITLELLRDQSLAIPRGVPFYLEVHAVSQRLSPSPDGLAWMEEWGFDANREQAVLKTIRAGSTFPTLNLGRLHAVLVGALEEPVETPLARVAIAFRRD